MLLIITGADPGFSKGGAKLTQRSFRRSVSSYVWLNVTVQNFANASNFTN